MYCDWCVHTELDRFGPALQVIESVADVLITTTDAPNTPAFWDDMTAAFMLAQLRSEVIGISSHLGTPNGFCSDRPTWEAFLSVLLEILIDRPLAFPNPLPKRVAPVFKSIQTKWKSKFKNTEGIQKVSLLMGTGDRKNAIFWAVELIPGPTCVPSSAMLTGPLKKP